ncbi:A24 family peptidase [Bengtsoniella intestinalis]|uniref:prepilin peptidase n=1 Tax=Bengtsoniella intestinalis TaxID=3073143 RepID=UPI00391F4105
MLQVLLFVSALLVASIWDLKRHIIPDALCVFVFCIGLLQFSPSHLLGILVALPLFLGAMIEQKGTQSIGGGDIKLTAACGFVLGFHGGMIGLIIGLASFVIYHGIKAMLQRRAEGTPSPMAPFLSIGFMVSFAMTRFYLI